MTGYDNIPAMFIKPVVEFLVSPLTFVINNYIATSNFPNAWKTARISPVQKITQPAKLKDYRPVSILPVLFTLFTLFYNVFYTGFLLFNRQTTFRTN